MGGKNLLSRFCHKILTGGLIYTLGGGLSALENFKAERGAEPNSHVAYCAARLSSPGSRSPMALSKLV